MYVDMTVYVMYISMWMGSLGRYRFYHCPRRPNMNYVGCSVCGVDTEP